MPPFLSLLPSCLLFSPHLLSQLKVEPAAQSHTPQHHGELIGKLSTMESSLESRFCGQAGKEMFGFKTALEAKWVKYSPNQTMLFSWERLPHSEFHFFHFVSLFASTGTELPMMAMTWVLNSLPRPQPRGWEAKVPLAFSSFVGSIFLQTSPVDKRLGKLGFQWSEICCDYWRDLFTLE